MIVTLRYLIQNAQKDRSGLLKRGRYPATISPKEIFALKIKAYQNLWRMTDAIAKLFKIKAYHFLQPTPFKFKELTPNERQYVNDLIGSVPHIYNTYSNVKNQLLELRKEGIFVEDLEEVFKDVTEDLYTDQIHTTDLGNILLAKRISQYIKLQK